MRWRISTKCTGVTTPGARLILRMLEQAHELAGLGVRQRLQQHRVDGAEDRGRSADADRERGERHDREAWVGNELADAEAHVAHAVVEEARPAGVADIVLDAFDAAECDRTRAPRLGGRLARALPIGGLHLEMCAQLFVQLALFATAEQDGAKAGDDVRKDAHRSASAQRAFMMLSIACDARSHDARSASSWRSPVAVSS